MTRFVVILCSMLLLWAGAAQAQERRVALVVGISHYAHAPALAHTLDDARDMAAALKRLHFDVDLVLDPDRGALESAVRRLGQRSSGAEASLFYYSGHGLESQGVNWVLPASADVMSDRDLRFEALDLSAVLEQIEGIARVSLVFLDACREDPFKQRLTSGRDLSRSGLAPVNATVSGTYIAFATAPGMIASDGNGRHSPFTESLLKHIETPGLEVRQMMSKVTADVEEQNDRQVPWDNSSLKGEFYFIPVGTERIANQVERAIKSEAPQVDLDALFWESIKNSKDAADFNAYLAKFPQGTFAELARNRLAQLHAVPGAPAAPDPNLVAALALVRPTASQKTLADQAATYLAVMPHRALVGYMPTAFTSWTIGRPSEQEAQDSALESCQVVAGGPCVLIAVDDSVKQGNGRGLQSYDMPRAHYSGRFDPERIPSVRQSVRERADVVGYAADQSPKAAAYHASGRLTVVTGATNQRAAEEKALADCTRSPGLSSDPRPCYLYASGNDVVLPRRSTIPITPAAAVVQQNVPGPSAAANAKLLDVLATAVPALAQKDRETFAARFQAGPPHKALVANLTGQWIGMQKRESQGEAEEAALESCNVEYQTPCRVVASDDEVTYSPTSAARTMPRAQYAGTFDPRQIPSVLPSVRQRADVTGYLAATGPKAAAYQPLGGAILSVVAAAPSQHEAEERALAACNTSAATAHLSTPCFLYASGNQVVLPRHATQPITAAAVASVAPDVMPPVTVTPAATPSFHDDFVARAATALPAYAEAARENLATSYMNYAPHKALAVYKPSSGSWRSLGMSSAELAEEFALEGCQAYYGHPCATFAVDGALRGASDGTLETHDMPRINYAGTFAPDRIPAVPSSVRSRTDVQGYAAATGPKAAALHPSGSIYVNTGAANRNQAETSALAACNGDKSRNGSGGPCYLYASGDQVVFPRRLQQPLTPATAVAVSPPSVPAPINNNALGEVLLARLATSDSGGGTSRQAVEASVRGYLSLTKDHKAYAVGFAGNSRPITLISRIAPSSDEASQIALEACQINNGSPCALVAVDNAATPAPPGGNWSVQDMPRVRYNGLYDGSVPTIPYHGDITGYDIAPRPKAMALNPVSGSVFIASGARSQTAAETQALAQCGTGCFLYAAENQVILTKRLQAPRTLGTTLGEVISYVRGDDSGAKFASSFDNNVKTHKALAMLPETGATYSFGNYPSAEAAERAALEGCGLVYNARCVTLAIDGRLATNDPTSAPRREMPRLVYQGPYRADMIPFYVTPPREAEEYARMREPKAMAIMAFGPKIVVELGATLAQAEANALAKCNDQDSGYPCFVYAANGQTILPQRHTEPQQ